MKIRCARPVKLKKIGGRFLGVYHAYPNPGLEVGPAVIGLCWSNDLLRWKADDPCLRPEDGAPGSVDSTFAHKPSVAYYQDFLYHFYCAVSGKYPNEVRGIAVARERPWS